MRRLFAWQLRLVLSSSLVAVAASTPSSAIADTRADARRYFQQGMALIDEGKLVEGVELLKKAYAIRPHPSVLFNIARAYTSAGEVDQALEYFERYLDTEPPDAARVQATIADLKERRRLRSLVDDGMTAIREGRYLEGVALLKRAYEARPHPNILFNIARAYEDAGDTKRAIATYEQYLDSNPRDAEDVRSALKRLRAVLAKKTEKVPEKAPPPKRVEEPTRVAGADKGDKGAKKPPEPTVVETVAPQPLDDAQLEKLAEMIAQLVKRDDGRDVARPAIESAIADAVPAGDATKTVRLGSETNAAGTSTIAAAVVPSTVDLEAKSGAAYEEVVVTASRREQSPLDAPNAVTIITDEDIRLSGARTIPDLLRRVPGMDVMAMSYSDYNVAMRGFNRRIANKILVLIDGRTAYEDFLGGMLWRGITLDLADIARIEVVRGPGSAIYGAYAYTGMVNIITKRPEEVRGSRVSVAAGNGKAIEGSYQYGERRGSVGLRASAGYERGDKYDLEFDPSRVDYTTNVGDPNKSLETARFDLEAEYALKDLGGRLFVGGGARVGFLELYGVAALRNQALDAQGYNVRVGYEGDLFTLLAFWNGLRARSTPQFYRVGLDDLGSDTRADVLSIEPIFRPTLSFFGEHSFVLGGEYRHKYIEWDYLDGAHEEDHFALFAQDSWAVSKQFSAIASARLDLHPIIGALASPRLALIYKPTERQAIRASIGTAFRQPTQAETYLNLSAASPVAGVAVTLVGGRDTLEPENIATLDVGWLLQPGFGELEAVVYVNRVGNLITRTPLTPTSPEAGAYDPDIGAFVGAVSRYVNDTRHYLAIGTELSTRLYPVDGVDVGASYALQYIFDEDTGDRFTDSPLHKVTVWGQLRTRFGMDIGLSAHVVSDQKWIEPNYDPNDPTGFDTEPLPIDASVVVVGRVGYRMLDDKLELAVSGTNLTDFGSLRHREHPYANRLEARVFGSLTARF
ncbi:TonB-dependent receptor [Myxococcota bacterium]|nr:TonB-dependent receptor [Myxococcota bacterium]